MLIITLYVALLLLKCLLLVKNEPPIYIDDSLEPQHKKAFRIFWMRLGNICVIYYSFQKGCPSFLYMNNLLTPSNIL